MKWSLLSDPLFRVIGCDGHRAEMTLPEVLASLARKEISGFTALQRYQRDMWLAFLVQIAVMGMARKGDNVPYENADDWKSALLELSDGDEGTWCLYVEDTRRPAFMQYPIESVDLFANSDSPEVIRAPKNIDTLVTANHIDTKDEGGNDGVDAWIYALVSKQTNTLAVGVATVSCVRSAGSGRYFFEVVSSPDFATRFVEGVTRGIHQRKEYLGDTFASYEFRDDGLALMWFVPWHGHINEERPSTAGLDPFFVESARHYRCHPLRGEIAFLEYKPFTKDKQENKIDGRIISLDFLKKHPIPDPWMPFELKKDKPVGFYKLGNNGIPVDKVRDLLISDKLMRSRLQKPETSGTVFACISSVARANGKTIGYHERIIPIPGKVSLAVFDRDNPQHKLLGELSKFGVNAAGTVSKKLVGVARILVNGNVKNDVSFEPFLVNGMDRFIENGFFEWLWSSVDDEPLMAKVKWIEMLKEKAIGLFQEACMKYLCSSDMWMVKHDGTLRLKYGINGEFKSVYNQVNKKTKKGGGRKRKERKSSGNEVVDRRPVKEEHNHASKPVEAPKQASLF